MTRTVRMDLDLLLGTARVLERELGRLVPDTVAALRDAALLRRATECNQLVQDDPCIILRTVWRKGRTPKVIHWLVGGTAAVGRCGLLEDRDWTACGAAVAGIEVGDRTWGQGTLTGHPLTCPECLALLRAASGQENP